MASDLDKRIQERAYEIWENEGRPQGRQHEHWQQARAEFSEAAAGKVSARKSTAGGATQGAYSPPKAPKASAKPRSAKAPGARKG